MSCNVTDAAMRIACRAVRADAVRGRSINQLSATFKASADEILALLDAAPTYVTTGSVTESVSTSVTVPDVTAEHEPLADLAPVAAVTTHVTIRSGTVGDVTPEVTVADDPDPLVWGDDEPLADDMPDDPVIPVEELSSGSRAGRANAAARCERLQRLLIHTDLPVPPEIVLDYEPLADFLGRAPWGPAGKPARLCML